MSPTSGFMRDSLSKSSKGHYEAEEGERIWIIAMGAIVIVQLWFGMIGTSFWLDEAGTWWIVKDGPLEAMRRAWTWSGQSPLYYLIAWSSSQVFGLNEIGLRIPSVAAMLGTIWLLYRIAERIYDRASAFLVAFVFLCVSSYYAIDARPYSVGFLCVTISIWALLRWVDNNKCRDAVLWVVMGTLLVYTHCLLALGLAAGILYAAVACRKQPCRLLWLALMQVMIGALCLPLLPKLLAFYASRGSHTITDLPKEGDLLIGFLPCALVGTVILSTWVCVSLLGHGPLQPKCSTDALLLITTWAWLPPAALFVLPLVSDLHLFVARYYSSAFPGQALLVGGMLSAIRSARIRKCLVAVIGLACILAGGRWGVSSHGDENWRDALKWVRHQAGSSAPVLEVSGFVEASSFDALKRPEWRDVLFAPELEYGEARRVVRLPRTFNGFGSEMNAIAGELQNEGAFFLIAKEPWNYETWVAGRFGSRCKLDPIRQSFGEIWVLHFTCVQQ